MTLVTLLLLTKLSFGAEVVRQNVKMPGDEGFGFFHSPGYCRIRTLPKCSFKVASTKLRNQIIEIRIKSNFLKHRTDDEGVFDVKFRCDKNLMNEKVKFLTAKYETSFTLKDAPKEIQIPEHLCNVEINF
jgi:hypothetical protein